MEPTRIDGLLLVKPTIHEDKRGYFFESYHKYAIKEDGQDVNFVQENESQSNYGVVRGLHFQTGDHAQAKLIRVVAGSVLDYAVDLRENSPTFGKYYYTDLNAFNKHSFYIPRGFAHGFISLEDNTILQYKCDNYYAPESEDGINFFDTSLGIKLPIPKADIIINERDSKYPSLKEYVSGAK